MHVWIGFSRQEYLRLWKLRLFLIITQRLPGEMRWDTCIIPVSQDAPCYYADIIAYYFLCTVQKLIFSEFNHSCKVAWLQLSTGHAGISLYLSAAINATLFFSHHRMQILTMQLNWMFCQSHSFIGGGGVSENPQWNRAYVTVNATLRKTALPPPCKGAWKCQRA